MHASLSSPQMVFAQSKYLKSKGIVFPNTSYPQKLLIQYFSAL
jgi:hypothetical protein